MRFKSWSYVLVGGLIAILILTFLYIQFTPNLQLTKPFLEDVFISQVTFDGNETLFIKNKELPENPRIGEPLSTNCDIFLKNIETGRETLIKRLLNFDCGSYASYSVSKGKRYFFFDTWQDPFGKKSRYEPADNFNSLYAYDIAQDKFIVIKQGSKRQDSAITIVESYSLIIPSLVKDEKIAFTKQIERINPTKTRYLFTIELWVLDINTKEEQLIYQENLTGDIWLQNKYQPFLTRWSPDGKAIIYEIGEQQELGQKRGDIAPQYNNQQYIYYLDGLKSEELKPENVKDDITKCGYYYNGALKPYFDIDNSVELRNKIFFPDGKTYIHVEVCGGHLCSWIRNFLKISRQRYCTPNFS